MPLTPEQLATARLLDALAGTELEATAQVEVARIEATPHVPTIGRDGWCAFCGASHS